MKRLYRLAGELVARHHEPTRRADYRGLTLIYPGRSVLGRNAAASGWVDALAAVAATLPRERPFVVDVGGNVGAAVLAVKSVRPESRILSVEPSPRFAPYLRRTIAANGWDDVDVAEVLLGAEPGERVLHSTTATGSVASAESWGSQHVPVREDLIPMATLDELVDAPVDLLTIDTDGYDLDVLLGAQKTLASRPVVHVEYAPFLLEAGGREPLDLAVLLRDAGYPVFELFSSDGTPLGETSDPAFACATAREHGNIDLLVRPPAPN